ncbi:MAG: hypothetical protein IT438_10830 [Phycisphaerales bacterium]|nr:hypothetical protein [Phycisphaerales bacterium]
MKDISVKLGSIAAVAFVVLPASHSQAAYVTGYEWNRQAVWNGGTGDGTGNFNPNNDSLGNPAWRYAAFGGGSLGSASPWWSQGPGSWLGSYAAPSGNRWYGGSAICERTQLIQEFGGGACPVVEWFNPTGDEATVRVHGQFNFGWGLGANNPVEFAIATRDRTTNAASLLFAGGASPSGPTLAMFDFQTTVSSNQSLVFTFRATSGSQGFYTMSDAFSIGYLVPTPSAASMLAVGVLGLARRRREP